MHDLMPRPLKSRTHTEKLNVTVLPSNHVNPYLLSEEKEAEVMARQEENKEKLSIPRR